MGVQKEGKPITVNVDQVRIYHPRDSDEVKTRRSSNEGSKRAQGKSETIPGVKIVATEEYGRKVEKCQGKSPGTNEPEEEVTTDPKVKSSRTSEREKEVYAIFSAIKQEYKEEAKRMWKADVEQRRRYLQRSFSDSRYGTDTERSPDPIRS
ncbi:hypothetical protein TNIN_476791 [Trichonephila inaurata madagascariensis]|uniref:Uncharacterized protein n=1 Tax=Trichonephila inaurata madagascariensis TaxID=2747483 RepID=A0A8X6XSF5_9ARAC|nr:hypothetical protein TNIN_476791 [Trichonephila inaurata madagascariensis]